MKRYGLISILIGLGILNSFSQDSIISIPAPTFLYALIDEGVDNDGDSLISYAEAEMIKKLDIRLKFINDVTGIEAFVNLDTLICSFNYFDSLDLSKNTSLKYLYCSRETGGVRVPPSTVIKSLNVTGCSLLTYLDCSHNNLTSLDVSNNTALEYLNCSLNQLTSLDISNNTALKELYCSVNQLTSLDVSNNTALKDLYCNKNPLTSLNVSNNIALKELFCSNNQLTSLDVSNNTALTYLDCDNNQLTSLVVLNDTALKDLRCSNNQLASLNISNNTNLFSEICIQGGIECYYGRLDLSNMPTLYEVCVWEMPFPPKSRDVITTFSPNVYFTTACSIGINNRESDNISIYPNPTNTLLTIETGILDHFDIEITSLNGQLLLSKEIEGTTHQLDLSSFQKGVYFITIRSKDFVTTRKIVKL